MILQWAVTEILVHQVVFFLQFIIATYLALPNSRDGAKVQSLGSLSEAFKESRSYYVGHMEKEASAVVGISGGVWDRLG